MAFKLGKCRLCLKLGDFYSIFTEDNAVQLSDMAMSIAHIKIADGDGLPDKVCAECIAKLSSAYIFKQQCERSDQELRKNYIPPPGFASTPTPTTTPPPSSNRQSYDSGFSSKTDNSLQIKSSTTPRKRSIADSNESVKIKTSPKEKKYKKAKVDTESQSDYDNDDDNYVPFSSTATDESDSNEPLISDQFKCDVCGKVMPTLRALTGHRNLHKALASKEKMRQMKSETPKSSPRQLKAEDLISEVVVCIPKIEDKLSYECESCGKSFKLKIMLNRHKESCSGETKQATTASDAQESEFPSVPCVFCDVSANTYDSFTKHFEGCPKKKKLSTLVCKTCRFPYSGKWSLFKHLQEVHFVTKKPEANESFDCSICTKSLKSQDELVKHLAAHMSNLQEVDMIIPEESRASSLDDTQSEHSSQSKEMSCPHCGKVFQYKKSLQTHLTLKHPGLPLKVPPLTLKLPPQADDDFSDEDSPAEDLTCDKCDKMFSYKRLLEQHKRVKHNIATGVKRSYVVFKLCKVECLLCETTFMAGDAVEHNRQHIAQKLKPRNVYSCSGCDEKFNGSQHLRTHITLLHRLNNSMPDAGASNSLCPADFCEVVVTKEEPADNDRNVAPTEETSSLEEGGGNFPCAHCGKVLKKLSTMRHHVAWCRSKGAAIAKTIVCSICSQTFNFKSHYRVHMKEHWSDINLSPEKLKCALCGKQSKHLRALQAHMNWHRQTRFMSKEFQCSICKRVFKERQVYLRHMRQHNKYGESLDLVNKTLNGELPTSGNQCLKCNKICDDEEALRRHMTWHNSKSALFGARYHCTHCDKQFTNKKMWELHERTHFESDDGPYKCHICGKGFISDVYFKKHVKGHNFDKCLATLKLKHAENKAKKIKCPICPRSFPNHSKLIGHMCWMHPKSKMVKMDPDMAQNNKTFPCKLCAKVFFTERRLLNHEARHNYNTSKQKCVCKFCNKTSLSRKKHNLHVKSHLTTKYREEPIKCFYCDETFVWGYDLHYHIRDTHGKNEDYVADRKKRLTEDPTQQYQCGACHKILASEGNYLRHLDYHNTLRCNYCFQQFSAKVFLDGHVAYSCEKRKLVGYTDDYYKKLKCDVCYKAFSLQIKLDCHLKTKHNRDVTKALRSSSKSTVCDYCFQVFEDDESLKAHKIYHRTIGYYGCIYCSRKFNTLTAYRKHKNHHYNQYCIEDPVKCEHCDETFTEFRQFIYHMRDEHNDDKEWIIYPKEVKDEECHLCKKVFHNLPRHMDYHEQNRCRKCSEYFFSRTAMDDHLCSVESDDDETPVLLGMQPAYEECFFCFKPVTTRTKKVHGSNHYKSGAITCRLCNRKFKTLDAFNIHSFSHRSSRYYKKKLKCPECKLKFIRYGPFVKHMRTEHKKFQKLYFRAKVIPQKCEVCQEEYPNLHNHYRAHLQHQCLNCKKFFTSNKVFLAHACDKEDSDPSKVFVCTKNISELIDNYEPQDVDVNIKYFADTDEEDEPEEPTPNAVSALVITAVQSLKPRILAIEDNNKKPQDVTPNIDEESQKEKDKPVNGAIETVPLEDTEPDTSDFVPVNGDAIMITPKLEEDDDDIIFNGCNLSSEITSEIICLDSD